MIPTLLIMTLLDGITWNSIKQTILLFCGPLSDGNPSQPRPLKKAHTWNKILLFKFLKLHCFFQRQNNQICKQPYPIINQTEDRPKNIISN